MIRLPHRGRTMRPKKPETTQSGDAPLYCDKDRPRIPTRFAIGLLKQIYGLSDEAACERWVYDPYFQFFTGEESFQHEFPHERSSHWRKRLRTN